MSLKGKITDDMKSAMKAGDKDRLKAVRLILAAIKQIEVITPQGRLGTMNSALLIQYQLKQVGIAMEIQPMDTGKI